MAVVQPLRPAATEPSGDPDRVNVVRLAEFLGPISPELVLVDPALAPRARALLPELPWNWQPGTRETGEPIALRVVELSAPAPRSLWRQAAVSAVAAAAAVSFGFGVYVAAPDGGAMEAALVESRPPALTSVVPPVPTRHAPSRPSPNQKPRAGQPVPTNPRFVWPAVGKAKAYRVALYRGGRQVFEKDVTSTGLQLPQSWAFQGRLHKLEQGTYRWVVWPLVGEKSNLRAGPAIVSARYVT